MPRGLILEVGQGRLLTSHIKVKTGYIKADVFPYSWPAAPTPTRKVTPKNLILRHQEVLSTGRHRQEACSLNRPPTVVQQPAASRASSLGQGQQLPLPHPTTPPNPRCHRAHVPDHHSPWGAGEAEQAKPWGSKEQQEHVLSRKRDYW
uniref:Uncharacterized protein n=1 Tax=Molossus molossus TaxID=27622 RepID=A0A7J8GQR7_MOLMO|nr:hypothetical protein HJG59_011290 [Molossus molossus]